MEQTITRKRARRGSSVILKSRKIQEKEPKAVSEQTVTRRKFIKDIFIFATLGYAIVTRGVNLREDNDDSSKVSMANSQAELKNGEDTANVYRSALQVKIEDYIDQMRESGMIEPDETTAWLVYDLSKKKELVLVNENLSLQSASMVKPLVALAFFHKVKQGELPYDDKSKRYLRLMIQRSRNYATNWIMQQIGGPQIVDSLLKDHYGDIFRQTEIVEYIPPGGTTYKNRASASDYNRFLYALWNNELPYSQEIKELMSLPKGTSALGDFPAGAKVMHKTGNTARLCGDIAILEAEGMKGSCAYTLISIIEKEQSATYYAGWRRTKKSVIREGANIVHDFMKKNGSVG